MAPAMTAITSSPFMGSPEPPTRCDDALRHGLHFGGRQVRR